MAIISITPITPISDSCPTVPAGARAITPTDADTFSRPVAVYVGGSGNIAIRPGNGVDGTVTLAVLAGTVLPCTVLGVLATGTTATGLVAVY